MFQIFQISFELSKTAPHYAIMHRGLVTLEFIERFFNGCEHHNQHQRHNEEYNNNNVGGQETLAKAGVLQAKKFRN